MLQNTEIKLFEEQKYEIEPSTSCRQFVDDSTSH